MKHLLILLSLLILTFPLVAQETGVLYFKKVNGKYGWFENGNDKKDWKYIGEIKNGKPDGTGVLIHTFGKYSGELKNGLLHGQGTYTYVNGSKYVGEFKDGKKSGQGTYTFVNGSKYVGEFKDGKKNGQGTYTYKSGRKRVGEFRKGKPWNVKSYDKNGKIETEWVKGKKLEKEEAPLEEKDHTENESYKIGIRVLLGNTSDKASTSNSSLSLIWENYGLGYNQMSFKYTAPTNDVYEMNNSSLDLSYTIGEDWILTAGAGYVFGGKGTVTFAESANKFETESVSGFGLFGLLGMVWEGLEGLIGARYYSTNYTELKSTKTSKVYTYPISDTQLIFGLGYSF